jgi:hypothetical protein
VFGTSHESAKWISVVVLNCAAILLGLTPLPSDAFGPLRHNRTVAVSEYILVQPTGAPLGQHVLQSVRKMTLDGFDFGTDHVDPTLFDEGVEF